MEEDLNNKLQFNPVTRREFINQLGLLASLAALYPVRLLAERRAAGKLTEKWLDQEPWLTLNTVQEHLFPAGDDIPGASDFNAVEYLRQVIENKKNDEKKANFIIDGVGWLNDLTQKEFGKKFIALEESQKETALRTIEKSRAGRRWLSLMLTYLIEALLSDPVYGGNPDGIGWKWLQHQPGFPKPPPDKTWYKLAGPVSFQRKADQA